MKQGWEYKRLGEVCKITMGQSPNGNSINNNNEGIEFHQGKTCFGERTLGISTLFSSEPTKLAEAHSVLLCVRAPVGFPNITDRQICIGRGLCALYAKEGINNTFLFYSLLGKQSYFEKNATGSTFKAISSKVVSDTIIPLPPKSTQLAIVSELDKINELIRLKKEQLKDYDNLAQSIFYQMFGDPVENEMGWDVKKLGEVCKTTSGGTPSKSHPEYYENGNIPWLRSGEVAQGFITTTEICITEKGLKNSSAKMIPVNSVAIAMYGATVGQVGIIKSPMCTNQAICSIFPNLNYNEIFLYFLLKTKKEYFLSLAGGGAQANISQGIIKNTTLPLPPLPLQQLFAQRIEQIERQKSAVQKSITDLETLLASRMQYWFE